MLLSSLVPFALIASTASAFPSVSNSLTTRFNNAYTLSTCRYYPRFLGYHLETLASRTGKVEVIITNKSTEEKGATGSGLHDNLIGECGSDQFTNWKPPTVLATERWTSRVVAYSVWFDYGPSEDPSCITRAIQKAENQVVSCTLPWKTEDEWRIWIVRWLKLAEVFEPFFAGYLCLWYLRTFDRYEMNKAPHTSSPRLRGIQNH